MSFNSNNLYTQNAGTSALNLVIIQNRDPTSNDLYGPLGIYPIGKLWANTATQVLWGLFKYINTQGELSASWQSLGGLSGDVNSLKGNDGILVGPDAQGNIFILGDGVTLSVTGNAATNTLTINFLGNVIQSVLANSGTATPSAGVLQILGASGITTTGSGNTVQISPTAGSFVLGFLPDTGTSPVVPNSLGRVTITGGTNNGIRTTGGLNQIGFAMFSPFNGPFTFTGNVTMPSGTCSNAPVNATDIVNKAYADAIAGGFLVKTPAFAATTANLNATYANGAAGVGATLTNAGTMAAFSVDGVSPSINSRILVKDQTTTFQNGIYDLTTVGSGAANWVLTRSTDYDQAAEIQSGDFILVDNGTVNAHTAWIETAVVVTIGTDPIIFTKFASLVFPVTIAEGGTNATSMANTDGIVYFDGTRLVTAAALTNGQLLIGSTGAAPIANTITAGSGISVTNASGSITIAATGGGLPWTEITATGPTSMSVNNGYITNNAAQVQLTLPVTAAEGSVLSIVGKGAGGWQIQQNSGQTIHFLGLNTTTGASGSLTSTTRYDALGLLCTTANTDWVVIDSEGNITVI